MGVLNPAKASPAAPGRFLRKLRENMVSYAFLLPFLLFFCVFNLYPIINTFALSFQNVGILSKTNNFVGLANFNEILTEVRFRNALFTNFFFILVNVPAAQIIALAFSMLLKKKAASSGFFETVMFLPMLLSMVAAGIIISYVLSPKGPLNYLLEAAGIARIQWFNAPVTARFAVSILELWKGAFFYTYIYLTALRNIPQDVADAAKIDGASGLRGFFSVTFQMIRNTIMFCVVMCTIWQFQIFDSVWVLTGGGPLRATETVIYTIYLTSFQLNRMGAAASLTVVFVLLILAITLIQRKFLSSNVEL